jgi:hypothetical protein
MDMTAIASDRSNVYLAGSVLCALVFSVLFYYRLDICHTAFPLTYSLVGIPLLGTFVGGRSFFDPKSGWAMVLTKMGVICTNLAQLGMGLLSLTGLGLAQCG